VITSVVGHTSAARAILALADSSKSDLVALSTHGRGGVERLLFGSVADKVIRSAKVPLFLLRAAED
jgi:nucleotide-binding universal stress UspA family protein